MNIYILWKIKLPFRDIGVKYSPYYIPCGQKICLMLLPLQFICLMENNMVSLSEEKNIYICMYPISRPSKEVSCNRFLGIHTARISDFDMRIICPSNKKKKDGNRCVVFYYYSFVS